MSILRVAILGFAHYHANFWAEAFSAHGAVRLSRVWDDDRTRGIDAAVRFRTIFCDDLDTILADVDAVAVTSETAAHEGLIAAAARAGRAILCEKPLAASLEQTLRIAGVLAAHPVPFMQGFPKRLDPVNHALREIVLSGELGAIRLARVRHGHAHGNDPAFTAGWWTDPERSGGGTLLDEGIHAADVLNWLFGPPVEASAMLSHSLGLAVEDMAVATFRWPDGMIGEIVTGWSMQAADVSIELYGTEGTALLSGVDLASRPHRDGGWLRVSSPRTSGFEPRGPKPRFVAGGFHQAVASAFADLLANGGEPPSGLAEAMAAATMIDAAYRAARDGRTVTLHPG
jgi:myo-inositol 2-dehydrogenase / D-chiro-inositol 1-dehydrogenase